jgi:caa(3)-type oxidase subunit IV
MSAPQTPNQTRLSTYVVTYVALIVLATLSWLGGGLWGRAALGVALGIGATKALLVLQVFMHLHEERFSYRAVMLVAAVLVGIFVSLTLVDPLTRAPFPPPPSQNPSFAPAQARASSQPQALSQDTHNL